ncbi:MAG: glycosyltransferase involved in cell wall biosynthesis [Planctomycetota bacterium]
MNESSESLPLLLHVFPTFVAAGAQMRTIALMEAFGTRYRQRVLALDGRFDALDLLPDDLDVGAVGRLEPSGWRGASRAARAQLAEMRPDLCMTYNWGSFDYVLAARSARIPHLHHEDGFNADEASGQKLRRVLARRFGLGRARRVLVPSLVLEECALRTWRLPPDKVRRIPNGVRLERFYPDPEAAASIRKQLGIPEHAFVIGAVGHLRPVKNFGRLIRSVAAMTDVPSAAEIHLVILGDGQERAKLDQLAEQYPPQRGRVHLVGHQKDLRAWYAAMDVFCLSSDSEQFPVSLLEAMACQRACVSTDVGDVRAVLPTSAGDGVVAIGEGRTEALIQREFAAALSRMLRAPETRAELALAGHERCREVYSFEAMTAAHFEEIEAALHQ